MNKKKKIQDEEEKDNSKRENAGEWQRTLYKDQACERDNAIQRRCRVKRIRIQVHVSLFRHVLPLVDLLDALAQVAPYLEEKFMHYKLFVVSKPLTRAKD